MQDNLRTVDNLLPPSLSRSDTEGRMQDNLRTVDNLLGVGVLVNSRKSAEVELYTTFDLAVVQRQGA